MTDEAWSQFVADFVAQCPQVSNLCHDETIERLHQNDYCILAHRAFLYGGSKRDITRLLEKGLGEFTAEDAEDAEDRADS